MLVTSPRHPLASWRSFDRSFDRAFAQLAAFSTPRVRSVGPTVSGSWSDDGYELTVDLPGVPDEHVAVSVTGRTVTLDVTLNAGGTGAAGETTTWTRSVRLPQTLDPEQVSARYVNGRLTVTVGRTPQPPAPEARRIAIDTAPAQPALAAGGSSEESPAQAENGEGTSVTG